MNQTRDHLETGGWGGLENVVIKVKIGEEERPCGEKTKGVATLGSFFA